MVFFSISCIFTIELACANRHHCHSAQNRASSETLSARAELSITEEAKSPKTAEKKPLTNTKSGNVKVSGENEIRWSLEERNIKYPEYNASIIADNILLLAEMKPIKNIDARLLEKSGKTPRTTYEDYFASIGNGIESNVFGYIKLGRSSVKSEIRHGSTAEKIATIEAIPDVINMGKVIFAAKKPNSDVTRLVVSAPITIGETPYYMGVMLQRDQKNQRLYLHNVAIIKEEALVPSQDNSLTNWSDDGNERLFITSILQRAINVKLKIKKNTSDIKLKWSLSDTEQREELARAFEGLAKTEAERDIVNAYRKEINKIGERIEQREKLIIRLKELEGRRGFAGERSELRVRISELTDSIKKADGRLFELEAAKPFKQLSERVRSQGAATKPGTAIIISSYSRLDFLTFYIISSIISFGCQNSKPIKI